MIVSLPAFAMIADRYDGFIFDVWGTLYDGGNAFPEALDTIKTLSGMDKKLLVLSNSPRIPAIVGERLVGIGFDLAWFTEIVTSGGMVADIVGHRRDAESKALGERVLWLGQNRFPDTVPTGSFTAVDSVEDAEWILNAGPEGPEDCLEDYESLLSDSRARNLPMICANPDKNVVHGGVRQICAGAIAGWYEEIGGRVRYFGKPFPEIFTRCLDRLGLPAERVLMVGDNLDTDVRGANRAGINSMLLGGGIHAADLTGNSGVDGRLDLLAKAHGAYPTYFSESLGW